MTGNSLVCRRYRARYAYKALLVLCVYITILGCTFVRTSNLYKQQDIRKHEFLVFLPAVITFVTNSTIRLCQQSLVKSLALTLEYRPPNNQNGCYFFLFARRSQGETKKNTISRALSRKNERIFDLFQIFQYISPCFKLFKGANDLSNRNEASFKFYRYSRKRMLSGKRSINYNGQFLQINDFDQSFFHIRNSDQRSYVKCNNQNYSINVFKDHESITELTTSS